jgi:hypothetical protein
VPVAGGANTVLVPGIGAAPSNPGGVRGAPGGVSHEGLASAATGAARPAHEAASATTGTTYSTLRATAGGACASIT